MMRDVLLLAAGRGERMRPLTDSVPKPLLEVGGKPLIQYHLEKLADAGFQSVYINLAHLGEQIQQKLKDGSDFGLQIDYSQEPEGALETGGGIVNLLARFSISNPFVVINADIWTDYPFERCRQSMSDMAHLVLVDNPPHHPAGDFVLDRDRLRLSRKGGESCKTFSGIGIYHHELFTGLKPGRFPLAPLLQTAAETNKASGEYYGGRWTDVGTPRRLDELRQSFNELS